MEIKLLKTKSLPLSIRTRMKVTWDLKTFLNNKKII